MCHKGSEFKFSISTGQSFDVVMSGPFNKCYHVKENSTWPKASTAHMRYKLIHALPYQIILHWPCTVFD